MTLVERTVHQPSGVDRRPGRPLGFHAAALAVLLVALFPLMSPGSAYTSDEGAYALQVKALELGGWEYEYRAAPHDPNGDFFPVVLTDKGANGDYYPYAKHPAFPLALRVATAVFGTLLGLHLLGLLAVVATAVAAWLLAAEVDPRLSRPAFWLAAAGPLLVNGYLLWAHAPSAAVAGLSLVAAVRVARRGLHGWAPVGLVAGLVGGVLLRSEGLLFAGAVVAALCWVLLRQHGVRAAIAAGVCLGVPPVATTWLEGRWVASIVNGTTQGVGVRGGSEGSYLAGRVEGGWHELFQTAYGNGRASTLGLVALLAVVGGGVLALRRSRPDGWLGRLIVPCAIAVAATAARYAAAPSEPVTGLFAAWPVALLGLVLVPWRSAPPAARFLGAVGGLYLLAILATQYPEGGGLEWGGRFLSPAIAIVAVLAVFGLHRRLQAMPDGLGRPAVGVLTALAVATAGFGLATVAHKRLDGADLVAAVARHPADVTITVEPSLPRLGWRHDADITWMYADQDDVPALLGRLHEQGVHQVAAVLPEDFPLDGLAYTRATTPDEPALASVHGKLVVFRQ